LKHFFLKFNYGVEIGAFLAYRGHYRRTKDPRIKEIAIDEIEHKSNLFNMLYVLNEKPSEIINLIFTVVGTFIEKACLVSPVWMLNFVARSMEVFAIFNYRRLSKVYPEFQSTLLEMAEAEERHKLYF
jgi:rubrerythrin